MDFRIDSPADYSAALYIRLSKEDENSTVSQSVINQKSILTGFAEKYGIKVYDIYIDDGWSGTNFDRPSFARMTEDIEKGCVNMVVTKDLSRLGRDYIMTGHYMEKYFPEHNVRYISILDGIDTFTDCAANEITPFKAIINDMYAKDISKKIKSVKRDKQKKGQFIGGKPVYGYRMHSSEKNKIEIDPKAAENVKMIFAMAVSGMSCREIAKNLNAKNIPSPSVYAGLNVGKKGPYTGLWSGERVSEMLRNETYIGNMVQGRSVKINYKSKKCMRQPKEKWIVAENTHRPIIDRQTFEKAGKLLESRRSTRSRKYDFPLKGLIFCHECGYPLSVINRKNSKGEDVLYFVCRTYQRFTKEGVCACHSIKEARVNEAVAQKLKEICAVYTDNEFYIPLAEKILNTKTSANMAKSLDDKINSLIQNADRVYMDRINGILSEEDFERLYGKIKAETEKLKEEKNSWESTSSCITKESLAEDFAKNMFYSRAVLSNLIERVEITENKDIILKLKIKQD